MGDDLTVVDAARVSFNKESEALNLSPVPYDYRSHRSRFPIKIPELSKADQKLITYLATHSHWTPFGHCQITLHIKTPIFIARQLDKHQIGLVKNEVSRRYVDSPPELYHTTDWRLKAANKKQGSSDKLVDQILITNPATGKQHLSHPTIALKWIEAQTLQLYQDMIAGDIAPEQARMILPQSTYTEYWWTGSLMAFIRIMQLRLQPDAQAETRTIAKQIYTLLQPLYPISIQAWDYSLYLEEL